MTWTRNHLNFQSFVKLLLSVCVPTVNPCPPVPPTSSPGDFSSPPPPGFRIHRKNLRLWTSTGESPCPSGSWNCSALASPFSFLPLSLFLLCWVMRRHRGHAEAGWEGHNDLCILLLSRLLWRTEGELLTLQSRINPRVSIRGVWAVFVFISILLLVY